MNNKVLLVFCGRAVLCCLRRELKGKLHESVAAALSAEAKLQGLSLEEYFSQLANRGVEFGTSQLSAEEIDRQFDELSLDVPPLPADFSRADILLGPRLMLTRPFTVFFAKRY